MSSFITIIYDRSDNRTSYKWYDILTVALLATLAYIFDSGILALLTFVAFLFFTYKDTGKKEWQGKIESSMIIDSEKIKIEEAVFKLEKLTGIKLEIREIEGVKKYRYRGTPYTRESGTNNVLAFSFDGQKHYYNFLIQSPRHHQELKNLIKSIGDKVAIDIEDYK